MMTKPRTLARIVVGCVLAVGAALLVHVMALRPFAASRAGVSAPQYGGSVPEQDHRASVQAKWKTLPMTSLGRERPEAIAAALARDIRERIVIDGTIQESLVNDLATRLGHELWARSAEPAAYCDMASEDTGTRWATESDPGWRGISGWFREEHQREVAGPANRELLAEFLQDLESRYQGRLDGACLTEQGCRVRMSKIRVRDQLWLEYDNALPRSERDYWMRSNSGTAYRFRTPRVSLDDILRRDGIAVVAACMVVVRTTGGEHYNLSMSWYHDPAAKTWVCHEVVRKGWNSAVYVYR